jgi:hypothetical protein
MFSTLKGMGQQSKLVASNLLREPHCSRSAILVSKIMGREALSGVRSRPSRDVKFGLFKVDQIAVCCPSLHELGRQNARSLRTFAPWGRFMSDCTQGKH